MKGKQQDVTEYKLETTNLCHFCLINNFSMIIYMVFDDFSVSGIISATLYYKLLLL